MVIISHKHKFIYIKTRKTASTSIQVLLAPHCGKNDVITPMKPITSDRIKKYNKLAKNYEGFTSHMSSKKIRKKVGKKIWNEYFKFTFERNPWDKLVSRYSFRKVKQDFNSWVKELNKEKLYQWGNYEIYTIKGKVALDFIGKYEHLTDDLKYVLNKINLPVENLTYEKKSRDENQRDYRSFYNEESKNIVEKIYKNEIELFGYEF
jgi:hypothetical protein